MSENTLKGVLNDISIKAQKLTRDNLSKDSTKKFLITNLFINF